MYDLPRRALTEPSAVANAPYETDNSLLANDMPTTQQRILYGRLVQQTITRIVMVDVLRGQNLMLDRQRRGNRFFLYYVNSQSDDFSPYLSPKKATSPTSRVPGLRSSLRPSTQPPKDNAVQS